MAQLAPITTIADAVQDYLTQVELTRSRRTFRTYQTGMNQLRSFLQLAGFDIDKDPVNSLSEQVAADFAHALLEQRFSAATINLYLTSLTGLYEFLILELELPFDMNRVRRLLKNRTPRVKRRLPQFSWEDIETVLNYCQSASTVFTDDRRQILRDKRDRAIILTLADTGLRVHEACNLVRSDVDWNRHTALITGKGAKDALVRFSNRSITAIQSYLSSRSTYDLHSPKPGASLPVFARHDRGAGKRVLRLSTYSMENIVAEIAWQALQDEEKAARITPHAFRHYFVTRVVKTTNNLKAAQELARHESITTTEIYTHLLDQDLDDYYHQAIEDI